MQSQQGISKEVSTISIIQAGVLTFDQEKLQRTIDSFFMVSSIHSAVFDNKGRSIAWSQNKRRSPLCDLLRRIPAFERQCNQSDLAACMVCKQTGKGYQYRCHIGLEEIAVPIITNNNIIVGYIVSGQLVPYGQREQTLLLLLEKCQPYGVGEGELVKAYWQHQEIKPAVLDAAFEILQVCAAYVWVTKAAAIQAGSLAYRISEYISQHLRENLSTDALSEALLISRSSLNRLAQEHFGMSLQQYVRRLRIESSKELLENSPLSISAVASQVGIPDYNYFSKVFKAQEGTSPREYRKALELMVSL